MSSVKEMEIDLSSIPQNLVHTLDPKTIKLSKEQTRYRQDMGDLKDLMASIKDKGQIQPIVITRDNHTLVAGGRRLAACLLGGMDIKAIYADTLDPIKLREIELEENIKRKAFTPAEEVLAVQEIHSLKQTQYGAGGSGKLEGWTVNDTAKLLSQSPANVVNAIAMAKLVQQYPELKNVKKKNSIKKLSDGLLRVADTIARVQQHEATVNDGGTTRLWNIANGKAEDYMTTIADGSVHLLLTDPPYGIDISDTAINASGVTGGKSAAGFTFEDGKDKALNLYSLLASESFRFTTKDAHGFIFVAPEFFSYIREEFISAGWLAYIKPIIWIKRSSGQNNSPHAWPSSCYEMILYVRKAESRFIQEGKPDWIECPIVDNKVHPTEKPVPLMKNLIERVALPYQTMVDPFFGSGASILAGVQMRLKCQGCDELTESYAIALDRLVKQDKET